MISELGTRGARKRRNFTTEAQRHREGKGTEEEGMGKRMDGIWMALGSILSITTHKKGTPDRSALL